MNNDRIKNANEDSSNIIAMDWCILEEFSFVLFGNFQWAGMLNMPVNQENCHYDDENQLDEQQRVGLGFVVVGLS